MDFFKVFKHLQSASILRHTYYVHQLVFTFTMNKFFGNLLLFLVTILAFFRGYEAIPRPEPEPAQHPHVYHGYPDGYGLPNQARNISYF